MTRYVGAIDQGTTSTRFIVFDRTGATIASAQTEHRQIYPQPGWVEHDPKEIWRNTQSVIAEALRSASLTHRDLAAIGITNQRETTLLWDRATGEPVRNAVVWQDTRVDPLVAEYARNGGQDRFRGSLRPSAMSGTRQHVAPVRSLPFFPEWMWHREDIARERRDRRMLRGPRPPNLAAGSRPT